MSDSFVADSFVPDTPAGGEGNDSFVADPEPSTWQKLKDVGSAVGSVLGSRPELKPYGAANVPQAPTSPISGALNAAGQTLAAPIRTGQTLSQGFPQAGGAVAESLGAEGVDPKIAAGAGTAVSMIPSVAGAVGLYKPLVGVANKAASVFSGSPQLADTGIRPTSILKMTPKGTNPASVGQNLESTLNQVGAIGSDPAKTWDNVNALKEQAGQQVGQALDAIRQQALQSGAKDPMAVSADKALKPILDGWTERAGNATGIGRSYAQPFEDAHTYLSNIAKQNDGMITMDDIKKVMDQVGPLTHKGAPEAQEAMSQLYGTLADAHDGIVQSISKSVNNPRLAQDLLDANASYSRFMRIMPDIAMASAKTVTQKAPQSLMQRIVPYAATAAATAAGLGGISKAASVLSGER